MDAADTPAPPPDGRPDGPPARPARLLVVSSARAVRCGRGPDAADEDRDAAAVWLLDPKFLAGVAAHAARWRGETAAAVLHSPDRPPPFGVPRRLAELPFTLSVVEAEGRLDDSALRAADLVLASGDNHRFLDLAARCRRIGTRCVYVAEYTLGTRLRMARLEGGGPIRLARRAAWLMWQETRRRRAFALCDGLQANGPPAAAAYVRARRGDLTYFDGRIGAAEACGPADAAARRARLLSGRPLTLVFSGRLERVKGADLLPALARALADRGLRFELHVFGVGALSASLRAEAERLGVGDRLLLRGRADFAAELAPFTRARADVFVCPHPQGDPSCSYLEAMACGAPVAGFANAMLRSLAALSGGAWTVPVGAVGRLADRLADLDADRAEIVRAAGAALGFARERLCEREFDRRAAHLAAVAGTPRSTIDAVQHSVPGA
jgi:glycosyltransferase involved in cell wall biosynthesis